MSLQHFLQAELQQRKQASLYRQRLTVDSPQTVRMVIDGREYLSFSANDYLGLAGHSKIIEALQRGAEQYGVGSGASHLVSGHSRAHEELEVALAQFTGRDRALLFSSGYMANLGIINALVGKGDVVLEDKLNHASLLDGGLLSGARFQRYLHNDISSLETYLKKYNQQDKGNHCLVVTDGVFSMDGDVAHLPELAKLSKQYSAWLMIDDAHGMGVLGEQGSGCANQFGLGQEDVPILMGTLGKAFGVFGAFVAGSEALIDYLIQFSRSYIYTTALPPALASATLASLQLVKEEGWRRDQLNKNIQYFRSEAALLGLPLGESQTPIQPLVIGDSETTVKVGEQLRGEGILVGVIRPPTVPEGTARLRITFSASHQTEDIDQLLESLSRVMDVSKSFV